MKLKLIFSWWDILEITTILTTKYSKSIYEWVFSKYVNTMHAWILKWNSISLVLLKNCVRFLCKTTVSTFWQVQFLIKLCSPGGRERVHCVPPMQPRSSMPFLWRYTGPGTFILYILLYFSTFIYIFKPRVKIAQSCMLVRILESYRIEDGY